MKREIALLAIIVLIQPQLKREISSLLISQQTSGQISLNDVAALAMPWNLTAIKQIWWNKSFYSKMVIGLLQIGLQDVVFPSSRASLLNAFVKKCGRG